MPLRHTYVSHTCICCVLYVVSHAITVTPTPHAVPLGRTLKRPTREVQRTLRLGLPPYSCLRSVPGLGTVTPDSPTILNALVVGIDLVTATSAAGSTVCVLSQFVEQVTQVSGPVRPLPHLPGLGPARLGPVGFGLDWGCISPN